MYRNGRNSFWGVDCIYVENNNGMNIYPINEDEIKNIYSHISDVDFSISYNRIIGSNSVMNVHRMYHSDARQFELFANYLINRYGNTPISMMEITGEAIDSLFSTIDYYFLKREHGDITSTDLLYGQDYVDKWSLFYQGQEIVVSLFYGEVLNCGIRSDAKIHPKILVSFPATDNAEKLYNIYSIIKFFLQVSRYGFNIGKMRVDLWSGNNKKKECLGELIDFSILGKECAFSEIRYIYIKPYIASLLQFAADHHNMQIDFFPNEFRGLLTDSYNGRLFASLYAGFERECHSNKAIYEENDDSQFKEKKKEIIEFIQKKKNGDDNKFDWFYNHIEERINQFGTQIGQVNRMIKAYEVLSPALHSSMENIFFMPSFKFTDSPNDIKKIARTISEFRGKIIHDGEKNTFTIDEVPYLRFLEILVYSMMLKRAGISNKGIERIIGVVFLCNYVILSQRMSRNHKNLLFESDD